MPIRRLPDDPSLEHLKHQAKALQRAARNADESALGIVREFHPRLGSATGERLRKLRLTEAQLVVARSYGFASWARLRDHLDFVRRHTRAPHRTPARADASPADELLRLACLDYGSDDRARWQRARSLLLAQPELARATIHAAAAVGDVAAARALLATDPDAAQRTGGPHDWEPLLYLAYSRLDSERPEHAPLEVARLLLAHGADPNAGYLWEGLTSPFTALTGALGGGERDQPPHRHAIPLARLLLEDGADANDAQALYNRQFRSDDDHLELLFAFGLGRGDGGPWHARLAPRHATPAEMVEDQLLWAARQNLAARVALLLRHGVDPDGRGTQHPIHRARTAWEMAQLSGNTEIAALLREAGAATATDPVIELAGALMRADGAAIERLCALDAGLVARTAAREPDLLIRAAEAGRTGAVRAMVAAGLPVDARVRHTALHGAAWSGHLETVRALVEAGANPELRDTEFHATPLDWARHGGRTDVVAWLEELARARGGGARG